MREAGWYWATHAAFDDPQVVQHCPEDGWMIAGIHGSFDEEDFEEIGDRIPTPDEPWQMMPVEPTQEMLRAAATSDGTDADEEIIYGMACFAWDWSLMLKAAPKP